jgi:two-component system response regulator NreC
MYPSIKVMMITQYEDQAYVLEAIKAGVVGYIPKRVLASELVTALHIISKGGIYLYPSVTKTIIESYKKQTEADDVEELAPKEKEILKLVVAGYTSRKISQTTGIPIKTVQNYRSRISKKLKTKNLASLIRYAINTGLVTTDR